MEFYISEEQIKELSMQLAKTCDQCNLKEAERVIRAAAMNAVKAYRQWLQSDNGTD